MSLLLFKWCYLVHRPLYTCTERRNFDHGHNGPNFQVLYLGNSTAHVNSVFAVWPHASNMLRNASGSNRQAQRRACTWRVKGVCHGWSNRISYYPLHRLSSNLVCSQMPYFRHYYISRIGGTAARAWHRGLCLVLSMYFS